LALVPDTRRPPPPWLINGIGHVRAGLHRLHRSTVPSELALFEIAQGAWLTQALYVATKLGIPDALADGPLRADDVARRVGSDPGATARLMRALASSSMLKQRRDGRFALTRVGQKLRTDVPGTMAPMIKFIGHPHHWADWGALLHSVRTGKPAAEELRGMPFFDYLETDPEFAGVFNDAMTGVSGMSIESLPGAYDFSDRKLIVDVGGGHGALLGAVLRTAPRARGVLFDLPSVVANAGPVLDAAGVSSRCTVTGGSFFESVPEGGDAYLLKTIIHDWAEEAALSILRNVRTAIASDGKLLLLEMVLPKGTPQHPGMLLDLEMLVTAGGRERTSAEYAELLARAGFRQLRVVPTASPISIVEAVPA
jgi:hypothetical protein